MKKNLKKFTSLVLASSMALALSACGSGGAAAPDTTAAAGGGGAKTEAPADTKASGEDEQGAADGTDYTQGPSLVIKYCTATAENQPSGHYGRSLSARLDELTGGRIKVECYYNSEMGSNSELLEGLQLGTIEMTCMSAANLGGFCESLMLLDLPYLFSCGEAANEAMNGEVGREILDELEPSGFHGLGWVTGGTELWRLLTANKEIKVPSDLNGIKIRIMSNQIHESFWNALGASPIPMAFSELYTALQNGTVDAQENPWGQIQGSKLYECQKYIMKTEHMFDFSPVVISKPFWDTLSAEDQALIQMVCDEIAEGERAYTDQLQFDAEKEATDYGCQVVELTPEEKQQWVDIGRSIYDKFADKIGQERIDKCLEISAKYE